MINNRSGQSIIEVVLAIGLASMVIAALIILGSASLRTATSSARRAEATKLANSGVEAIRFVRDSQGFLVFRNLTLPRCFIVDGGNIQNESCTVDGGDLWEGVGLDASRSDDIFQRKIIVEEYGREAGQPLQMVKVTSIVRWPESPGGTVGGLEGQRSVVISTVLSSW